MFIVLLTSSCSVSAYYALKLVKEKPLWLFSIPWLPESIKQYDRLAGGFEPFSEYVGVQNKMIFFLAKSKKLVFPVKLSNSARQLILWKLLYCTLECVKLKWVHRRLGQWNLSFGGSKFSHILLVAGWVPGTLAQWHSRFVQRGSAALPTT